MLVVENKKPSQVAMVAGRLCRTLLDLDKLSKDVKEIHTDLEKEIKKAGWIDYKLVWDEDAQKHFLAEWHDHLIGLGLKPGRQRDLCLSLVFKWVNRIPGDD